MKTRKDEAEFPWSWVRISCGEALRDSGVQHAGTMEEQISRKARKLPAQSSDASQPSSQLTRGCLPHTHHANMPKYKSWCTVVGKTGLRPVPCPRLRQGLSIDKCTGQPPPPIGKLSYCRAGSSCHRGELSPQPGFLLVGLGVTTYGGRVVPYAQALKPSLDRCTHIPPIPLPNR